MSERTKITKELLSEDGWVYSDGQVIFMEKEIPNRNPINNAKDETGISLVLHGLYNSSTFAVSFPDGGMLNFAANSMEDLKKFEQMLNFYDPNF